MTANPPVLIGVIGSDDHEGEAISDSALTVAEEVGRLIAEGGSILVSGGRGGVMLAASRGAREAGGIVVGFLPGLDRTDANPYVSIPLCTGLGPIRNHLTITASDAIIMIAGSTGTLNEATITYGKKPLIVVLETGGWADRLVSTLYDGVHFDERASASVRFVSTAQEAAEMAVQSAADALDSR